MHTLRMRRYARYIAWLLIVLIIAGCTTILIKGSKNIEVHETDHITLTSDSSNIGVTRIKKVE